MIDYVFLCNTVGHLAQYWNGTGAVNMVSAGNSPMDGYVYSACNIITAGEHAGSWIRVGFHPSPQPAPSPSPPAPPVRCIPVFALREVCGF